ncbi:hypothetical protein ACFQ6H_29570 [Rhodococcus sp. NPDC056506]|uniref:hypothetical protein n=2 Tax=unclassified Rhodococcus (in: high G+C Gram-positive bacteria) TaxID=192944 RepID=UPI003672BAD6
MVSSRMCRRDVEAAQPRICRTTRRGVVAEGVVRQGILGADAVTADRGICEAELDQTRLKEMMIERAGEVYILAHSAKLGERPFHAWAPIPPGAVLVTDAAVDAQQVALFEAAGIRVQVV